MESTKEWPSYLIDRALAEPPADCFIVEQSTPVVAFGNPVSARVATLGINPSCNEFLNRRGELLIGKQRRLTTWESLGISRHSDLTADDGKSVLEGCADYFNVRSYGWFNPLNEILNKSIGATYGETACHLDLVQWATKPVWRDLDLTTRNTLLREGVTFLAQQLRTENYQLVLVNGRTALRTVEDAGIVTWRRTETVLQNPTTELFVGGSDIQRFIGWSCNLQSQPGARRHMSRLANFVKDHANFTFIPDPTQA